jgi:fructokinase
VENRGGTDDRAADSRATRTAAGLKRIGIDLGGTKIEAVVLDDSGEMSAPRRVPTPRDDYEATLDAVCSLVREIQQELGTKAPVGIGMPGSVSTVTGAMKNCNSTCLNGRHFRADIEQRLSQPVPIANDADCFTLSEAIDGAAADGARVFGVILGTGVGGGIVERKRLLAGPNGLCGEWGHNRLAADVRGTRMPARECYCGRLDCVETYLSGPGFSRTYQVISGRSAIATEVAERASSGEAEAREALELYVEQIAFALSQVINILDPDVIVLGGGLSKIDALYDAIPRRWLPHVFSDAVHTRLARARFGDSSGVRGAAWQTIRDGD